MSNTTYRSFTATIKGETRLVECRCIFADQQRYDSIHFEGLYQKRPGQKVWPDKLYFFLQKDGSYRLCTTATILNRSGYRLVGWNGDYKGDNYSQHNSAAKNNS